MMTFPDPTRQAKQSQWQAKKDLPSSIIMIVRSRMGNKNSLVNKPPLSTGARIDFYSRFGCLGFDGHCRVGDFTTTSPPKMQMTHEPLGHMSSGLLAASASNVKRWAGAQCHVISTSGWGVTSQEAGARFRQLAPYVRTYTKNMQQSYVHPPSPSPSISLKEQSATHATTTTTTTRFATAVGCIPERAAHRSGS